MIRSEGANALFGKIAGKTRCLNPRFRLGGANRAQITKPLLCQLSYGGVVCKYSRGNRLCN